MLDNSLMSVTALAPTLGYDQAAKIAKLAHRTVEIKDGKRIILFEDFKQKEHIFNWKLYL